MRSTTLRRYPVLFTRACLLAAVLAGLAPAAGLAACPTPCVSNWGIVHAAGVPLDKVAPAVQKIEFDGKTLTAASEVAIAEVAREVKALGPKAVLNLQISTDGLTGAGARALLRARAAALKQAFAKAGLAPNQLVVKAG